MTVPEPTVTKVPAELQDRTTTLDLRGLSAKELSGFSDGNGFLDAGETALVTLRVRNYVTNPMNAHNIAGAVAFVESKTPGASLVVGVTAFPNISAGSTASSLVPLLLRLDHGFDSGQDVTLSMRIFSLNGDPVTLEAQLHTGTPMATPLVSESFDGVAPGTLPAGWQAVHGAGGNVVPWTTTNGFCGAASNGAFHVNANDGLNPGNNARWERLIGPAVNVPADADWVEVEFDVCTDTEDDPSFNVQAYDGLFLRVFDGTPGGVGRSELIEAFQQDFTTGNAFGYPKHFPRNDNPSYFEDMSVWAGDSGGFRHVKVRLPGMAGARAQLRFEFAQDDLATCADVRPGHACGVLIDNVTMTSFKAR
jgi:hypothetical protein